MDTFRIVVISDTHKDFLSLRKIAERHMQNADLFIHLGDLEEDVKKLKALYPNLPVRQVRGNCDFGSKLKTVDTVEVGGAEDLLLPRAHDDGRGGDRPAGTGRPGGGL